MTQQTQADVVAVPDEWLASVLGRPTFRVVAPPQARSPRSKGFYYAKVPIAETSTILGLCQAGFYPVDTALTLERRAAHMPPVDADRVCVADAAQADAAARLAGHAFRYSRFHQDPAIPSEDADRIKSEWIRSYARGERGDNLFVALDGTSVEGFLAALSMEGPAGPTAVIDLIAVDRAAQGRGIGRALIGHFMTHYGASHTTFRVGTQAANIPSLALYQSMGFRIVDAQLVLHAHVLPED